MGCPQVINHEVEWSVARNDFALQHQDQMRPTAQLVDGNLRPLKYRAHADRAYEVRGFLHTVCLQNDVRDGYRRTLLVCTGFAGTRASKTSCRASPTSPANCDRRDPRPAAVPDSSGGGCARIVAEVTRRPPEARCTPSPRCALR